MRNLKEIDELLEDCRNEMQSLIDHARAENRELNHEEFDRFHHQLTPRASELKAERERAIEKMRGLVAMSNNPGAFTMYGGNKPKQVLPTNGILPSDRAQSWTPESSYRLQTLKCFHGRDAARDAWHAGMYMRAFVAHHWNRPDPDATELVNRCGWTVTNAAGEGSGASGGYLVPAPLSNAIIEHMERVGVARQVFDITPMTADTLSVPKRAGGLTAYYVGENQAITDSEKNWRQIELVAKKRAVASLISSELVDDALINVVDNLFKEMAHALALKQDGEVIAGDGTSNYGGVNGLLGALGAGGVSTAVGGHDTWPELDLADFTTMMGKLPDQYHAAQPAFICSSAFYFGVMLRVMLAAGGNAITALQGGDGGSRNFLGYPVHLTEAMPKTTATSQVSCLFGAFNMAAVLGERMGVRIARSDDYRFLHDQTALKATTRYDFHVHAGGDANTAGAYVGLATAAS